MSRRHSQYLTIIIILVAIAILCLPALFLFMFSSCPVGQLSFIKGASDLDGPDVPRHVMEDAQIHLDYTKKAIIKIHKFVMDLLDIKKFNN